jgi:hypothetical protein
LSSKKFRFFRNDKVDKFLPSLLGEGHPLPFVREPDVLPAPHPSPEPLLDPMDGAPKGDLGICGQLLELLDITSQVVYVRVDVEDTGHGRRRRTRTA